MPSVGPQNIESTDRNGYGIGTYKKDLGLNGSISNRYGFMSQK